MMKLWKEILQQWKKLIIYVHYKKTLLESLLKLIMEKLRKFLKKKLNTEEDIKKFNLIQILHQFDIYNILLHMFILILHFILMHVK